MAQQRLHKTVVDSLNFDITLIASRHAMNVLIEIQHSLNNLEIWAEIILFSAITGNDKLTIDSPL